MPQFSRTVMDVVGAALGKRSAPIQGGLLQGTNVIAVSPADPLRLFVLQLVIILLFVQLLNLVLKRINQPRVISEVIGGILLGPTVMGRIPGFTKNIFPTQSIPYLTLVANISLVMFLFLVGLEIDTKVIKRNARLSLAIGCCGMILPFGVGAGYSRALYHQFIDPSTNSTHFLIFIGVCFAITAFPVLCRILTQLKLLETTVGLVVLSAGVGNDIVGWILLAVAVSLVNASSGLTALWILLTAVGWVLLLLFPIRYITYWLAKHTGSLDGSGPSTFFMSYSLIIMFLSAFFTDVIGIHPIFGGFLAGLVIPREAGLAISLTEKLEDIVQILFLPLYFTLSGLSTNLGLLNTGATWGFLFATCVLDWSGKFGSCTLAARFSGFSWREATTVGSLMSCKGLVELIVLNIGLQAGILNTRVFSMFVLEALILTFMTTPVVQVLYPPRMRVRVTADPPTLSTVSSVQEKKLAADAEATLPTLSKTQAVSTKSRFTVVLDRMENVPPLMMLAALLQSEGTTKTQLNALRLISVSERTSDVMRGAATETLLRTDAALNVFRAFGALHRLTVSGALTVGGPETAAEHADATGSEMVLAALAPAYAAPAGALQALFEDGHAAFVRNLFHNSPVDVALLLDAGAPAAAEQTRILLPFFGGADDRAALALVLQLAGRADVTARVVRVSEDAHPLVEDGASSLHHEKPTTADVAPQHTVYDPMTTQARAASGVADDAAWAEAVGATLSRVTFGTAQPRELIALVGGEIETHADARVVVVVGRRRRETAGAGRADVGASAGALVAAEVKAAVLVVQAATA